MSQQHYSSLKMQATPCMPPFLSPATSSPNFLAQVTPARFLGWAQVRGDGVLPGRLEWGPGVECPRASEFSMQTLKPQTTLRNRWRAVQASFTEPGVAGFVERHASCSRGAGARVRLVLPSGESVKCSESRRAPAQVPANRPVCSMGTV